MKVCVSITILLCACMHALATFHRSFDPIELVDNKGYFYPCHGQHPDSGQFWKARECLTFCVKPRRRGLVRYCDPCHKNRKSFLQLGKRKEDRVLLRNEYQLLEGLKQEGSSTRPYATMTPQTAKNRLRANPAGRKSMKKQINYLKKKLEADIKTMKTRLVTVVFVNS